MNKLYIGTSGYSYAYWKNRFYPEKLPAAKWLNYYSEQFNSLELNYSFYKFPVVEQLKKMAERTPEDFRFTVKANKVITHTLRMRKATEKIIEFTDIVNSGLENKLACILFQLPPSYSYTEERLNDILTQLDHQPHNVIEFRHASWWTKEVYLELNKAKLTFCSVSYPGLPDDDIVTSSVFYKRMHGMPELFKSSYSAQQLKGLSSHIPKEKEAFIYFNNTTFEAAYTNARTLISLM